MRLMRARTPIALTAVVLALAACVPDADAPAASAVCRPGVDDNGLIGQRAADLRIRDGLTTRIVAPGMMVTMDYMESRITVTTDESGRVIAASCG